MAHRRDGYDAAWVPADASSTTGLQLAVDWLMRQSRTLGRRPMLVVPSKPLVRHGPPAIVQLANQYPNTTERTAGMEHTGGPVLSYAPSWKGFQVASRYAQGAALVAVEWPSHPLRGWAVDVGALDLSTGGPTPNGRDDEYRHLLDYLHQNGNNGWTRGFGADMAISALRDAAQLGPLDEADILGAMLARGHDSDSLQRLRELIRKADPQ